MFIVYLNEGTLTQKLDSFTKLEEERGGGNGGKGMEGRKEGERGKD